MLTEERHSIILDTVNKNKSVELGELCELPDSKGLPVKVPDKKYLSEASVKEVL